MHFGISKVILDEVAADEFVFVGGRSQQTIALFDAVSSAQNILETNEEVPMVAKIKAMPQRPQAMMISLRKYSWDCEKINVDSQDEHDNFTSTLNAAYFNSLCESKIAAMISGAKEEAPLASSWHDS